MTATTETVMFWCNYSNHMVNYTRSGCGTGYATYPNSSEKICYDCCAVQDRKVMSDLGKYTLYLTHSSGKYEITNWPGTLRFPVNRMVTRRHNWGLKAYHVWFVGPDGYIWHGVTIGDNTQLCHCSRTKAKY